MRLIDVDSELKRLEKETWMRTDAETSVIRTFLAKAKETKAEPVKHGRWLYDSGSGEYFCSNCGEYALSFKKDTVHWENLSADDLYEACLTDYCPNCGAKMDLEE